MPLIFLCILIDCIIFNSCLNDDMIISCLIAIKGSSWTLQAEQMDGDLVGLGQSFLINDKCPIIALIINASH